MPWKTLVRSIVLPLTILAGCVTSGKSPKKTDVVSPTKPNNTGTPTSQAEAKVESGASVLPPPTPADMAAFVQRYSVPGVSFGEKQHQYVAALPNKPERGSLAEAALAIGIVNAVNNPEGAGRSGNFEQDLMTGNAPKLHPRSLESQSQARGLSLPLALESNPLLATHGFATQVLEALKRHSVSDDYKDEIQRAIRYQADQWAALVPAVIPAPVETATPVPAEPEAAPDAGDGAPLNPADLKGGDSTLADAQSLADRGEYKAAVKKAKTLPATSPMRATAEEKIKEFSNRGVQALRRKAAEAFQNARPLSDPRARMSYLLQAKAYLEEALIDYPESTVLPTVRDNLRMITRDLEQIEGEKR